MKPSYLKTDTLEAGSILNHRYRIEKQLGRGGFSITYLAEDLRLEKDVVVKEFYLYGLSQRVSGGNVRPSSGNAPEAFEKCRVNFRKEARIQASLFEIPSVVKVLGYFEENNTVYEVMEYVEGITLRSFLENNGETGSFEKVFRQMLPILNALSEIHKKGYLHRDISPDNIMVQKDGRLKLLDFGSSRTFSGDPALQKTMTVFVKEGFTPPEQYDAHGKQGPWSDVYSSAAVIYFMLTGYTPDNALERRIQDHLCAPSEFGCEITPGQEQCLMQKGLAIAPGDRYQTMAEFIDAFSAPPELPPKDGKRSRDFLPSAVFIAAVCAAVLFTGIRFHHSLKLQAPANAVDFDRDSDVQKELADYLEKHAGRTEKGENESTVYILDRKSAEGLDLASDHLMMNMKHTDLVDALSERLGTLESVKTDSDTTVTGQYGTYSVLFVESAWYETPNGCRIRFKYDLNSDCIFALWIWPDTNASGSGSLITDAGTRNLIKTAAAAADIIGNELKVNEEDIPSEEEIRKDLLDDSNIELITSGGGYFGYGTPEFNCLAFYNEDMHVPAFVFLKEDEQGNSSMP